MPTEPPPPPLPSESSRSETCPNRSVAPPTFDPERYREHLKECDLTRSQEDDLLRVLWDIMCGFVDLGLGLDSVQIVSALVAKASADEPDQPENGEDADA